MDKINSSARLLAQILEPLIGATIRKAHLLIWPTEEGISCADSQLNLELKLNSGKEAFITFRTSPDGQTPMIENERVGNANSYALLSERIKKWKNGIYADDGSCHIEAFEITSSIEFQGVRNAIIQDIELVCYASSYAPAGLRILLSSEVALFSVSAGDGNRIFTAIPDNWFGEKMFFRSINRELKAN